LQVINSSPGDLTPVFDAVLEKATRFCEAAFGTLWTYDGERFQAAALRQVPQAYADFLSQAPLRPVLYSGLGRVAAGKSVVHSLDVSANDAYWGSDPGLLALLELGKARTTLAVPLRKDGVVLGALTVYRQEVTPFTDKQIALLQNFAAQAVIAMENARLMTETREALEQQTATAEVLGVINSSPGDLAPVFDAMLVKAMRLCDAAFGVLDTHDGEAFRLAAHRGLLQLYYEYLKTGEPYSSGGAHARLTEGADFGHLLDAKDDAAYPAVPSRRALVDLGGARTVLVVPLRKDGILLGSFALYRQEVRQFSGKQIALLQNFAAQAVIAMENARLLTETREALEQQTATAEVLQVINSSPGDLAPVFNAILRKAHTLCGATLGSLVLRDGERLRAVATHGYPEEFAAVAREGGPIHIFTSFERLLRGERLVHVPDASG
jgi:GAF domain-containing protein